MDKETQLLHEHESLRSEIRIADSLNYQIIGIVVGAVALLLTTAFKEANPTIRLFVFLCTYVVTIPAYRLLQGNRRRTWRISTYIQVFIEPQLEQVKWESRLQKQGQQEASKSVRQRFSSLAGRNEWLIISVFNALAGVAAIFNGLLLIEITPPVRLGGAFIIAILNVWLAVSTSGQEKDLRRGEKIEKGHLDSWLKIKAAEE
jgi:hypothetical protein